MKKNILTLSLISSLASVALSNAATVTLTGAGPTFNVFLASGVNIGTVSLAGPNNGVYNVAPGVDTLGSDSIGFGAQSGTNTITFALTGGYSVDQFEFGTAGGVGNLGENTPGQRPIGYAASFNGVVFGDPLLTLNTTVTNGGPALSSTPVPYTAGEFVVHGGPFINSATSTDAYTITSGTGLGSAPVTFTYGLSSGGGDTDTTRFSFTVVPEPTSAALLGLGGLALIGRRKRA